jgi:hypothetical protein
MTRTCGDSVGYSAAGICAYVLSKALNDGRLDVPGPDADVPVEAAGRVVADLDDPGLAAFPVDGDLPVPQVHVAALRVIRVEADLRYL